MIFTSVSRLGDFLLLLPVASWYYKTYNEKIHWVLSENFPLYKKIEELLYLQNLTQKVSYVSVGTDAYNINHWKFNPADFGILGEYYNFGFTFGTVYKYFPYLYADMYNLGVDNNFIIDLKDRDIKIKENYNVWLEASNHRGEIGKLKTIVPSNSIELKGDFIEDILLSKYASNRYFTMGGFMIIMDLMNIICNVYGSENLINNAKGFYRNKHNYFII